MPQLKQAGFSIEIICPQVNKLKLTGFYYFSLIMVVIFKYKEEPFICALLNKNF